MKRAALVAAAAALAAAGPAAAQQDTVPAQPRVHVVRRGDTLWDLARQYLSDPFLWPQIFRLNTGVVSDPARIYPNERLVLPGGVVQVATREPEHTVFFEANRPNGRQRTVLEAGTADIPVVREGDFYTAGFVARDNEVRRLGRVAEIVSPTVVPLERRPTIQLYDRVFVVPDSGATLRVGEQVEFVHGDRTVERYGRLWLPTGLGTVTANDGSAATVTVVKMYGQVMPGNVIVPVPSFPVQPGVRPSATTDVQGKIVAFQRQHPAQATEEIAFLDVGRQAGVKEGDEFEVFIPRSRADWGTRPEVAVGRLQVVKVTEGTASARITGLEQPAIAVGQPVRRVAKMP